MCPLIFSLSPVSLFSKSHCFIIESFSLLCFNFSLIALKPMVSASSTCSFSKAFLKCPSLSTVSFSLSLRLSSFSIACFKIACFFAASDSFLLFSSSLSQTGQVAKLFFSISMLSVRLFFSAQASFKSIKLFSLAFSAFSTSSKMFPYCFLNCTSKAFFFSFSASSDSCFSISCIVSRIVSFFSSASF